MKEEVDFKDNVLKYLTDNLNSLRMRFTQNHYVKINKEDELNDGE